MPLTPYLLFAAFCLVAFIILALILARSQDYNVTVLEVIIALAISFIPFVQCIAAFMFIVIGTGNLAIFIYDKWQNFFDFEIKDIAKLWSKDKDEDTNP